MTVVEVDGETWSLHPSGHCFRRAKFVPWAEVPSDVRLAYSAAQRERRVSAEQGSAIETDFVVDAYVRGTNPLKFRLRGKIVDSGTFSIECAERFGWTGKLQTLYRKVDDVLLDAGIRAKAHYSACYRGRDGDGVAHVPKSIEAEL